MNRREFIKTAFNLSVLTGAAIAVGKTPLMAVTGKSTVPPLPELVAIKGGEPGAMFEVAIKAIGGMGRFVKKGQTVLVKPNIGWDVAPEFGADTNPDLVYAVIKSAYAAGAKRVSVFDHTCDSWEECYKNSGIEAAVRSAGGVIVPGSRKEYYKEVTVPGGVSLKKAMAHELLINSDVFINVPVLKSHGSAGITAGMKNLMGTVWDRGSWHATDLHQRIADFAAYRKPDLVIVDAYRVMMSHGPKGIQSLADVAMMRTLLLSRDLVAAEAAAVKLFGQEPAQVKYLRLAAEKGLGKIDLSKVRIQRIEL
ncbi:MAG: DUF362 domain-containing protein [Spirochaetia bacterium]|nr:DUF362 domain-containing protein [Spirochaetia bacterium]